MKRKNIFLPIVLMVLFCISFVSCENDKESTIIGKWIATKSVTKEIKNGKVIKTTTEEISSEEDDQIVFQFENEGKFTFFDCTKENSSLKIKDSYIGTWEIEEDLLSINYQGDPEIKELTIISINDNHLELKSSYQDTNEEGSIYESNTTYTRLTEELIP